ncbi:MAG: glycosyltransferase family 39 protein [Candidatus Kaelpia aquatica]|nr:glycosyltransferase family 39 protein [Candidatus Kaelpia aquatica]
MLKSKKIKSYYAIVLLSAFFWCFALSNISSEFLELGGDSAQYLILAKSISSGYGHCALNLPGEPFFDHYPPVFSTLLSFIIAIFGLNYQAIYIFIAALGYVSLILIYCLMRNYLDRRSSLWVTLLTASNLFFFVYITKHILTEALYLFLSLLSFLLILKYFNSYDKKRYSVLILSFILIILSYFTRYIGISLFLAVILFFIKIKRDYRAALSLSVLFSIFFLIWRFIPWSLDINRSYIAGQFWLIDPYRPFLGSIFTDPGTLILRIIEGVNIYRRDIAVVIIPLMGLMNYSILKFILLPITLFVLFGLYLSFKDRERPVFNYYFIIYMSILIVWPYRETHRFLMPIIPFLYYYFIKGIIRALIFIKIKHTYSILAVVLLINIIGNFFIIPDLTKISKAEEEFISLHGWINDNIVDDKIILSRKPTVSFLLTEHKSLIFPYSKDPNDIWDRVVEEEIGYIVVDNFSAQTRMYLGPFLYRFKDKLNLIYTEGESGVFEVLH